VGTGVLTSVGVKTGWIMETSLLLSFFGEESQNGETASKFLAKIPSFFFPQKEFSKLLPILGEHVITSQLVCLLVTILMILYKKCRQLRRNLSESVWA